MSIFRLCVALCATFLLGACATNGKHTQTAIGPQKPLANVSFKQDQVTTRDGNSVESPIKTANVYQLAFTDPATGELMPVPDGRGNTMKVIRWWDVDTTEPIMRTILPMAINTVLGGVLQGEYGLKAIRTTNRLCEANGGCGQPPVVVNALSNSNSVAGTETSVKVNTTETPSRCAQDRACLQGN